MKKNEIHHPVLPRQTHIQVLSSCRRAAVGGVQRRLSFQDKGLVRESERRVELLAKGFITQCSWMESVSSRGAHVPEGHHLGNPR